MKELSQICLIGFSSTMGQEITEKFFMDFDSHNHSMRQNKNRNRGRRFFQVLRLVFQKRLLFSGNTLFKRFEYVPPIITVIGGDRLSNIFPMV